MKSLLNALQEGRLIELPDTDKEKSLAYLAHLIEAVPDLAGTPELAEAMLARERSQNTALGLGVACPHVRAAGNGELLSAVGWSPQGIDYGATDGKKVHLVVMYYIPDTQKGSYLKEISGLAGAIRKEGGIQSLANADNIGDVRDRLLDWVSQALDASLPEAKARMIKLEAKQAVAEAAPLATGQKGQVQVVPVLVVMTADNRTIVLCQNPGLWAELEKDPALGVAVKQKAQFDRAGYRLVFRQSTSYEASHALYEYLAIRMG